MQFHFEIEYKKGRENKATDSLSRVQLREVTTMVVIPGMIEMFDRIKSSWVEDPTIKELLIRLQSQEEGVKEFTFVNQQLRRNGKLVVGPNQCLEKRSSKSGMRNLSGGTLRSKYDSAAYPAIQITPFEALYGQTPPIHLPYVLGDSAEEEVDIRLSTREFRIELLKFHISRAQQRMILQKVGPVAYKLSIPPHVAVHYTFHVSQLKPCYAVPTHFNHPPTVNVSSPNCVQPKEILEMRMIKRGNKAIPHILDKKAFKEYGMMQEWIQKLRQSVLCVGRVATSR
ncbi:hypothetical protein KY284_020760 [Solanum tuberosum]|nr:hypothetical protein KY284_020760 [Solanum tuberosum]